MKDEALRDVVRESVQVQWVAASGRGRLRVRWELVKPPVRQAFEVFVRTPDGKEHAIGTCVA